MASEPAKPRSPLEAVLGRLIKLFREQPGRDDLVRDVMRRVEGKTIKAATTLEAGIENTWGEDGDPLKQRLLSRAVDAIHVLPGATPDELLELARALAVDEGPIPSSEHVRVAMVAALLAPPPPPPTPPSPPSASARTTSDAEPHRPPPPRERPPGDLNAVVGQLLAEIMRALAREQWHRVLHDLQAVLRMMTGLSGEARRMHTIALKKIFTPATVDTLIEQAYRLTEEQGRTAEVLRGGGIPVAEHVLDILRKSDTLGPRAFLLDAVAGSPELFPMIAPMAKSPHGGEAWLAAELLGRLGLPEAVPLLAGLAAHRDERARHAAIEGLGRLNERGVVEALRLALGHEEPATRIRAGRMLAARGSRAITMPLVAALESEKDPKAWEELLEIIARLDGPDGPAALVAMAIEKPSRLDLKGAQIRRQLAIVRALAGVPGTAARQALARIANEGHGDVKRAAQILQGDG